MSEPVTLELPNGQTHPGTLFLPSGPGPHPAIVLIHDITGMQADTHRHGERFASEGFVALAPDLYKGSIGCVVRTLLTMVRHDGAALDVVEAARRTLSERSDVRSDAISVTGFCMGGGFALLAGADHAYAVSAPFYGAVPGSKERLEGLCPTLAQFGSQDLLFRPHASRLSRHLEALGIPHEVLVHPGAGHSFMNDHPWWFRPARFSPMQARYDADTEALAWEHLLRFLREHLPAHREG